MTTLAGKTLFITGGSRGIGLAIALRAACEGANVAIAAKTVEPHPKLPGTIFTAAEEVAGSWTDPVRFAIDAFGPERCMLESNFPVDRFSMPYATLWEAMDILTDGYSAPERSALFHDTAVRAYRLDETSQP